VKTFRLAASLAAVLALAAGVGAAADALKSGPQVKDKVPGPFEPLNINGEQAGKENCLYCEFGPNPVVMIFAHEPSPALTTLIKKLDEATARNGDAELRSCVIFCSKEKGMARKLHTLVKEAGVKKTVLALEAEPDGPEAYKLSREADVTVLLYSQLYVKANFAFRKGELTDKDADKILAALPAILK
jgi:hypothetical protein